ncbi:anaphase-promoting complex subunit 1-like [Ornithodoros turicata]
MIAAGEPLEFVPFGSEYITHHPGSLKKPERRNTKAHSPEPPSTDLSEALSSVSLQGSKAAHSELWKLRECSEGDGEEELYVSGDCVVWSRSDGSGARTAIRTFCLECKVQDAVWCTYLLDDYKTRLLVEQKSTLPARTVPCICILDTSRIVHSFSRTGEDYTTAMPFLVSKMWEIEHGLLFERSVPVNSCQLRSPEISVLFSLLHPLDDVAPVITRVNVHGDIPKFSYLYDTERSEVVSTCVCPSMLVMYHREIGTHSVWQVRRTTQEEDKVATNMQGTERHTGLSTMFHSMMSSPAHSPLPHSTPVMSQRNHAGNFVSSSPIARAQSPSFTHMATLSRSQSPLQNSTAHQHCNYNSPMGSHWTPLSVWESTTQKSYACGCTEPLVPDICLERLWVEPKERASHEKASKTFFTQDFLGRRFLCYLLPHKGVLNLVSYEEVASSPGKTATFGQLCSIAAVDAVCLKPLHMILILDSNLGLTLYTGSAKVCKVHVPTSLTNVGLRSYLHSSVHVGVSSCTPKKDSALAFVSATQFGGFESIGVSPVPKASFLSRDLTFEDATALSPISLRNSVANRVSVELPSGTTFRLTLPQMSKSTVVSRCLEAFKKVLPADLAMLLHGKWYMSRNAPGPTDMTASSELRSFLVFMLSMTGYAAENLTMKKSKLHQSHGDVASPIAPKKCKASDKGSVDDWTYLLTCQATASSPSNMPRPLPQAYGSHDQPEALHFELGCFRNSSAPLFPHIHGVLFCVHLIYEDSKLNVLLWDLLPILAEFLYKISSDLSLSGYLDFYRRDFPEQFSSLQGLESMHQDVVELPKHPQYFLPVPPSVLGWIQECLKNCGPTTSFPYIPGVTELIRKLVLIFAVLTSPVQKDLSSSPLLSEIPENFASNDTDEIMDNLPKTSVSLKTVMLLTRLGVTTKDLGTWPSGAVAIIQDVISQCQEHPPPEWTAAAYELIGRQDLVILSKGTSSTKKVSLLALQEGPSKHNKETDDGFDKLEYEVLRLRFSKDQRISEVCKMLQSSVPVNISIQQRPDVSDHEFIEEQERHLYTLSIRTMALPLGRGMFTLRTYTPIITETLPVPKLCLTGRVPSRNTTVDMLHIDVPPNMNMWPLFHNGASAGLRIAKNATAIDSSWVVFNKPRAANNIDATIEHAGFLLGLGLNGHLAKLDTMAIHDYLLKNHELTSVGLLLGLAASRKGSMDLAGTKLMSIHIEALLPPTSTELDVHSSVRVASVMGLGLLYAESGHRHMAEILLGEIGHPPGPEMDHCVDRESYALASGLALGFIMLGKGTHSCGLSDLPMADQLYHYMVGGHVQPSSVQQERYKFPCYQIREGSSVNVDVTSPGATLALGLMFFNSGNMTVAEHMSPPNTKYSLDTVRPDFLLLRTLSRGLILWSKVYPRKEWVESHLPAIVTQYAFSEKPTQDNVDYETMGQAYCNILAGACFCLGLKFAGSANREAFDTLHYYTKLFLNVQKKPVSEQAGKNTLESCLMVTVLSLALVMAGTGNLVVLRICRYLRSRVSQAFTYVLYGSHMALHMAVGLLFLGGGKLTLNTSAFSVASMICAFFPRFPIHSSDNRYHLQAFRHFYTFAVEPRLVVPVDINTRNMVYVNLTVRFKATEQYESSEYTVTAPCHLPELHLLESVSLKDTRYWPIVVKTENWGVLKRALEQKGHLYVRQKAGCLPYVLDPKGYKTTFARSAIKDLVRGWLLGSRVSESFSEDPVISKVTECFLQPRAQGKEELSLQHSFCKILMECTLREKTDMLSTLFDMFLVVRNDFTKCTLSLWQFKLVSAYYSRSLRHVAECKDPFIYTDFIFSLEHAIASKIEDEVRDTRHVLAYLRGSEDASLPTHLFPFLILHDLPAPGVITIPENTESLCLPEMWLQMCSAGMTADVATVLMSLLQEKPNAAAS